MLEEPGDEVERLVDKSQAIAHHRFDGFPDGEVSHFRVLLRCEVDDVANTTFVTHAPDEAKVIEDLTALGLFHDFSSQEEILPTPKVTQVSSRFCRMLDAAPAASSNSRASNCPSVALVCS